jgi:arylsulfatase A-like enzyme
MASNVLLVVLDTARRDAIEPYAGVPSATPTIAELARRGRALESAYATANWTLPSHASMFTGLLPRQVGLGQAPHGTPQGARALLERFWQRMLPQVLSRAGYTTLGWSTNLWVSPRSGFDIGFDRLEYVSSGRVERMEALVGGGVRAQLAWAREGLRSQADDGAAAVGRSLRNAIARWSGSPTFWFVNLSECHSPYLPPRPWNDLGPRDRVLAALEAKRHLNLVAICLYAAGHHSVGAPAFARMRYLYRRAIAYMDEWLASVLDALDARGILEDTLVIVTADHGENFGEGGLIGHGFSLDQRLVHVPLVIAGPGTPTTDRIFSLAELPALVADAVGIADHPWQAGQLPEGFAIAQHDPLGPRDDPKLRAFAREHRLDDQGVDRLCARLTCVTDGSRKLLVHDAHEFIYDLSTDPEESQPLHGACTNGTAAALQAALRHSSLTAIDAVCESPPLTPTVAPSAEELEAIERQMKLLGYM